MQFRTTFDDIFNEAFNSYQTNPTNWVEIKVIPSTLENRALARFEKYCSDRNIYLQKTELGENHILLKVDRSRFM